MEIVDVLVRGAIVAKSEDLENKSWLLERDEKREVLGFFVLECG